MRQLSVALDQVAAHLERAEHALQAVRREVDSEQAWLIPRIRPHGGAVSADAILIPIPPQRRAAPPPGCSTVSTDEGEMWVIDTDQVMTPTLRSTHTWEPEFTQMLARYARPGMTVMDIGANIGYVSRTLARLVRPSGRVIAVEPEPRLFEVLGANLSQLAGVEIHCVRAAALDHNGAITLWLGDTNLGDNRTWGDDDEQARTMRVAAVRVDDLLDPAMELHLAKIDTQGTDHLAVAGMESVIARCRPTLLVEFWLEGLEGIGESPGRILDFYRSLGFSVAVVDAPDRAFNSNEEIIDYTERNRGRYVDLLLRPIQPR